MRLKPLSGEGMYSRETKKDKAQHSVILLRIMQISLIVIMLSIFLFFIYGQFFTEPHRYFTGKCEVFNTSWSYVGFDGETHSEPLPGKLNIEKGETVRLTSRLPGWIEDGLYMCFLTNRSMRVYIHGELRLEFDSSDNPLPGGYVKSHYMLAPLHKDDLGMQVVMDYYEYGVDNTEFNEILIGDKIGIIIYLLKEHGRQFMTVVILFVLALMLVVVVAVLQFIYKAKFYILHLATGIALLSLWFIFDSFLYQIAFSNYFVDGPMEYMLVMTIPFFFMLSVNYAQKRRHEKVLMVAGILLVITDVIMTFRHFLGLRSYQYNLPYIGAAAILVILVMLGTIVIDVIKRRAKDYSLLVVGFVALFISGIIQAAQLLTTYDNHSADPLIIGMYIMLFSGIAGLAKQIATLRDEEKYAKQVSQIKSNFLANMSHEIRTPVNAILGLNEMIGRETTEPEIGNYSDNIRKAGKNLLNIINDILDFTKIESGRMDLVCDRYRLRGLLDSVDNQISELAKRKGLDFSIEVDPQLPDELNGDENRLSQVLINLLNNAVKYTSQGSVKLKVSFAHENPLFIEDTVRYVRISFAVSDTGIGIKPEDMARLFNKFERLEMQKNKGIEGTGLGLAISNNLVRMMNGNITVTSKYNEGSTFTATVVQEVVGFELLGEFRNETGEIMEEKKQYKPMFMAPEAKILVVDDSPVNIMVVKGLLKQTGVITDEALSGMACLEKCTDNVYDLILLDHMMPEMDGIETLHRLRDEKNVTCPVIALTANAISGMKEMYLNAGFDDYLTKPTKPEDLERTIKTYLPVEKLKRVED